MSDPADTVVPMRATGTFTAKGFVPAELKPDPAVSTGLPVGAATMEKHFDGEVAGRSATLFDADGTHRIRFDHGWGPGR
nr:hypothetical protein StreXyl84_02640 [Streptomyces sp. Xyl84]